MSNIIIHEVIQGTPEWHEVRKGHFTASRFGDLFMTKSTKTYNNLINDIVFERITGEIPESFSNGWTERGKELEPEARDSYEFLTFNKVHQVGFIELNEWIGCSPDGLIGDKGDISIKCPKYSTAIEYMLNDKIPKDYDWQMQGELYITGREWCDYFVYHPKLNPLKIRVYRDEKKIDELKVELNTAIETAKLRIKKLVPCN